ncbi:hypothetical protein BGZ60DRAFT_414955 [Tricladium varicosporioides]|nr:hypothetical protein BGZ60DRAFT_414955 [Hymenoscyphus varicosporioides]
MPTKTSPIEINSDLIIRTFAPWLVQPTGLFNTTMPPFQICGSWVGVLPKLLDANTVGGVLPSAVLTLGLTISSSHSTDGIPSNSCIKAYSIALNLLRRSLESINDRWSIELVATSTCLCLAEAMLPTSQEGKSAHLKGVGKVMQLSGPSKFVTGVPYQLFVGIRPLLLFDAFETRTSTFLAAEDWRTVPYSIYSATPLQSLLNLGAAIPSLLERFDSLTSSVQEVDLLDCCRLWNAFGDTLHQFDIWEHLFRLNTPGPPYWRRDARNEPHLQEVPWQKLLWFPDVFVANALTHLWGFRIICITHQQQLEMRYPGVPSEGQSSVDCVPSVSELTSWICGSMEFLMQDEGRLYGAVSTVFPLRVAYRVFKEEVPSSEIKMEWCRKVVGRFVCKGVDLGSLL